ncbi:MAG: ABC transporter substrate-binding protein [Acetobacteraceae bacterium]|nr:ABC transporter substrate-binding protein [Acetobacteraceae bacterium]
MRRSLMMLALLAGFAQPALAEIEGHKITIGVLTDLTGGNATAAGEGSVVAAQLAAEEAQHLFPGTTIEVISADHQNKADIASTITRDWMANKAVNVVADVPFSSAGLAVNEAVRGAKRTIFIASGPGTSDLTGSACSPNTVHWTYDTYATSSAVAKALVAQGGKTWFFISADYAFGAALERDGTKAIQALGGTVIGSIKNPPFASDFSSYLLTAQASGAEVIGFANATIDLINLMKQAREFGMGTGKQRLAGFLVLITDVQSLGLEAAQGLFLASPFYWNFDDRSRAFSDRFAARMNGSKPTMLQAGVYSGLVHYFKAVKQTGTTDAAAVMAAMESTPADDDAFGKGSVRKDGRALHDFHLFQVKKPSESSGPWDDYKLISTIPGEQAFRPLAEGGCKLVQ